MSGTPTSHDLGHDLDSESLRWAVDAVRLLRTPVLTGILLSVVLVIVGAVVLAISGLGIDDRGYVSLQVPFVISGGFGGLGLIVCGSCLASILGNRRDQAMADEELKGVLTELTAVVRQRTARRAS